MIRTIINYIVEKYLASILEINTEETQGSLWSGQATMKNLKIKPEIFETINLPYFELVNGYVGKLDVILQLPRFWLYPIKISVDKVFFHARQKSLNNLDAKDEIQGMENYKNRKLQSVEEFMSQMDELSSERGMAQQIMNNLQIEVGEILIRFDDEISYPGNPFAFGVILNQILIRTTTDKYEESSGSNGNNIPMGEINHKLVKIRDLSIYLDYSDNGEPLDYHKRIVPNVREEIPKDLWKFLDKSREFYAYAMSEIKSHSTDFTAHGYLLYQMNITLRIALNENLSNGSPKVAVDLGISGIQMSLSLKQFAVINKLLSYLNLKNLYRVGIYKSYYKKELTNDEKNSYMKIYISYYQAKYIKSSLDPDQAEKLKKALEQFEVQLTYDQVQSIRQAAKIKTDYLILLEAIEKSIQEVQGNWKIMSFMRRRDDDEQLKQLLSKKEKLMALEGETNKKIEEELEKEKGMEVDTFKSLSDEFILYSVRLSMKTCIMAILECEQNPLVDVIFEDFEIRANIAKNAQLVSMYLGNVTVNQHQLSRTPYNNLIQTYEDEILFQDRHENMSDMMFISSLSSQSNQICQEKKGAMYIEFEINPHLPNSNYRVKIRNEKRVFIIANLYSLQYTLSKVLDCLKSSIDLNEVSNYARGEVSKYIQEGYVDQIFSGNYPHFNIDADISLKGPVLIIPQNICDESNRNVIMISLGELIMNSNLPPRRNNLEDYLTMTDEKKLYDNYGMLSQGLQVSTLYDYDGNLENIFKAKRKDIIDNVNLTLNVFNLIEPKNENFENAKIFIRVSKIEINIRDTQIEYFIDFLDGMATVNQSLETVLKKEENNTAIEQSRNGGMMSEDKDNNMINLDHWDKSRQNSYSQLSGSIPNVTMESVIKRKSQGESKKKTNKAFVLFDFLLSRVEINILKTLTPEERYFQQKKEDKKFFNYVLNNFRFNMNLTEKKDMKVDLKIYSIFLFDCDVTYTAHGTEEMEINPEFQCIMGSVNSKEQDDNLSNSRSLSLYSEADAKSQQVTRSFVEISYDFYSKKNKADIKVNFTKLLICINLSTLLRVARFGNFYYDLYSSKMARHITRKRNLKKEVSQLAEMKELKASLIPKKGINLQFVATLKRKMTLKKNQGMMMIKDGSQSVDRNPSIALKSIRTEQTEPTNPPKKESSRLNFSFEMKEIELNFPLNPESENTKVLAFNFNMMVKLRTYNKYENFYGIQTGRLIRQNFIKKNMNMNLMIFNVDFDIINFVNNSFTKNLLSDKILSNFRMTASCKSFLLLEKETSVSIIDLHLEPMSLMLGFRQTQILTNYSKSISEFLGNLNKKQIDKGDEVIGLMKSETNGLSVIPEEGRAEDVRYSNYKSQIVSKTEKMNQKIANRIKYNTANFNSLTDINFKLDKASIKLIDNTGYYEIPLLKIEASKISFKSILNSDPSDSENMANALVEMMTGKEVDLINFNMYNLYKYLDACFNVEMAYYNEKVSDWEPIMEPWNAEMKINQVAKMTRMKVEIASDVMINLNLSYSSLEVFNKIMKKLGQKETDWEEEDKNISLKNKIEFEKDENFGNEVALEFFNNTGVEIGIWFDADVKTRFGLKTLERKFFTKNEMNLIYRQLKNEQIQMLKKDKFSFTILNSMPITDQDFSYNHFNIYRITLPNPDPLARATQIELSINIQNSGLIKSICIESNVAIFNNTQYKIALTMIKAQSFMEKYTAENMVINFDEAGAEIVEPQSKVKFPLSWLMDSYMTFGRILDDHANMKSHKLLFEDLNFMLGCYDELKENEGKIECKEKEKEGEVGNGNIALISDSLTKKYSKIVTFENSNSNTEINLSLDLLVLKSSSDKQEKLKQPEIGTSKNFVHCFSYIIVINPPVVIENQIPYEIQFLYNRSSGVNPIKTDIAPLQIFPIFYLNYLDNRSDIKVGLRYLKKKYFQSDYFGFLNNIGDDNEKSLRLANNEGNDFFDIKIKYENPDILNNLSMTYQKLVKNISHSKKISFYVDYLIVNKTNMKLFLKAPTKEYSSEPLEFIGSNGTAYKKKVSLFHYDENKVAIRNKISEWSRPFQITTHGVDGVVSLETKCEVSHDTQMIESESMIQLKKQSSFYTDLAIIITSSSYFHHSTLLVLEPRYLLINRIGLDLKYCQVYCDNLQGDVFDLKANDHKTLTYVRGEEKDFVKLIQVALVTSNVDETSMSVKSSDSERLAWSSVFNVDGFDEFDIKFPVYPKNIEDKKNLFTYDRENFFLLVRVIICSEDNGLICIILCPPKNPQLTIDNQTSETISVWQKNVATKPTTVKVLPKTEAIFTWADLLQQEKQVVVNIYDGEDTLSFQKLEKVASSVNVKENENVFYTVNLKNKNTTRTLKVQTDGACNQEDIKAVQKIMLGKRFATITKVKLSMRGLGLSIIDEIPREVFYISCYCLDIKYSNNILKKESIAVNTENVEIYLKNFQIDYCLEDSFPNILYPKNQIIPSKEKEKLERKNMVKNNDDESEVPFVQVLICRQTIFNILSEHNTTKYPQIDLTIQEMNLKVHQFVINTLVSLSSSLVGVLDFYKKEIPKPRTSVNSGGGKSFKSGATPLREKILDPGEYDPTLRTDLAFPETIIAQKNESTMILIEYLMLSALRINLTLRVDVSTIDIARIPGFIIKILGTLGNAIASISDSPLKFNELINYNVFTDVGRLVQLLQKHYTRQGILEFYKIIGSSDLLGNPVGFVDKIGTGFFEFFNEPRKGFMKGPTKFGEGIAKGVNSLISNIVGGSLGVVGNITGTLYAAAKTLQGEKVELKQDEEPTNLFSGAYEGVKGGVMELGKGIAGIFVNPYKSAKAEGVKGFFKGVGTGLLGAIISPFSAALKVGNSVAIGLKNTATFFNRGKLKTSRFRHPRVILENEQLKPYDEDLAEVHAILKNLKDYDDHKVIFFEDFQYSDPGYENAFSTLILTDKRILVVYDAKEIAFDLELDKIKSSEVHLIDGQFVLMFKLDLLRKTYIKTSNLGLCCQLHGILSKIT